MARSRPTDRLFAVEGKSALVTGGTSGIGLMIAEGLVRAGARVLISSRKADACAQVAAELSQHGICQAVPADVSTPDGVDQLAAAARVHCGDQLHILVNNAGATWGAPIEEFPDAAWEKLVDLNLVGVFRLTAALLDPLRTAATPDDPARVINIGSVAGIQVPRLENYAYSSTKAAVHMLTRHLASRLAEDRITVNALAPGYFESRMSAFVFNDPGAKRKLEAEVPLGRAGSADDIVGATLFLASRAGSYLTGTVLPVDGGLTGCA